MPVYEIKDGVAIIPEGTTEIAERTFYGESELTSIVIPDSVTQIGGSAFYRCSERMRILVPVGKTEYYKELIPVYLHDKIKEF